MGTRGVYGFRKGGKDKITYNHMDSHPEVLGKNMVKFCNETSLKQMHNAFDSITLVKKEDRINDDELKVLKRWTDFKDPNTNFIKHVPTDDLKEWYWILRNTRGDLDCYTRDNLKFMIDSSAFVNHSLFCEWGYIVNLDTNRLEILKGLQREEDQSNRYGTQSSERGFYPCTIVMEFPLDAIPKDWMKQVREVFPPAQW